MKRIVLVRTLVAPVMLVASACSAPTPVESAPRPAVTTARPERPLPYPVFESPQFTNAVSRGTRTRAGRPGPNYWQQWSRYRLEARLDPATSRLSGRGTVKYFNRSPDALASIYLHLSPNLFAPNAMRNEVVPITTGLDLSRVALGGRAMRAMTGSDTATGYRIDGTILRVKPASPLASGDSVEMEFEWAFTVPPNGAPRTGRDDATFFVAYWYPQLAVYDDVVGWQIDPYMGNSEFYMGYADYDVQLTLPEGWLVGATGTLQNPEQVLTAATRARLDTARRTGGIVHVVREGDRAAGRSTARGASGLTWRFAARAVRDFAFGTSDQYLWDATTAEVGDATGDGRPDTAMVHTLYRPTARNWNRSAEFSRHSVDFLSRYLWPYPYPHMTAVDGMVSCSGMEYPMMTCIGGVRDTIDLYGVTLHEIAHMWFPMQVGTDERRYAWLDEGLTRFNQAQGMHEFFRGYDRLAISRRNYETIVARHEEVELMRHGDQYPLNNLAYSRASYDKMALNLVMLRSLLGDSLFMRAYREYGRRWINKHPTHFDFFNTFNDVSGRDLSWFWRSWFYETWTLDHAIGSVTARGGNLDVTVQDRGLVPMPVRIVATRSNGQTERLEIPVEAWLAGARAQTVSFGDAATIVKVQIDPDNAFNDIDRSNQTWTRN